MRLASVWHRRTLSKGYDDQLWLHGQISRMTIMRDAGNLFVDTQTRRYDDGTIKR